MKKYIVVLLGLMTYFTSCTDKDDVDIKYQVDFTVSPEKVMSGFEEYKEGDFTLDTDNKVRIRALVYDMSGNLMSKTEELVDDYAKNLTFSTVLPIGEYNVITSTDVVEGSSASNISSAFWSFSAEENLSKLTISRENLMDYMGNGTLGLSQTKITVNEPTSVAISVKPITAMIYCLFKNFNDFKGTDFNLTYLEIDYKYRIDKISNAGDTWLFNSTSATTDKYRIASLDLTIPDYEQSTGIYNFHAFLPETDKEFEGYVEYIYKDGKKHGETTEASAISIESGKQYTLYFDVSKFNLQTYAYTSAKAASAAKLAAPAKAVKPQPAASYQVKNLLKMNIKH